MLDDEKRSIFTIKLSKCQCYREIYNHKFVQIRIWLYELPDILEDMTLNLKVDHQLHVSIQ